MNANVTRSPSRRRRPRFFGSPARSGARDSPSATGAALRVPPSSGPSALLSGQRAPGPPSSAAPTRSGRAPALPGQRVLPSSSTSRTAPALNSSVNRRRGRLDFVECAIVDIVSAFWKVSTRSDQAHRRRSYRWRAGGARRLTRVCATSELYATFVRLFPEILAADGRPAASVRPRAGVRYFGQCWLGHALNKMRDAKYDQSEIE